MQRFIFDTINTKKHNAGIRTFQSLRGGYILLDYIWLDDKSPILEQLPSTFKSAAILLHPFVQMPLGWEKSVRKDHMSTSILALKKSFIMGNPFLGRK